MPLQRDTVVRTALRLLDTVGLDGLTVRRLADELGVQNPALYWHFRNKRDLLDRMAEVMLSDAFAPIGPSDAAKSWEDWLVGIARAFRSALLSHRDGARVIAGANLAQSVMPHVFDEALHMLRTKGFSSTVALNGVLTTFAYTFGSAFDAQTDPFDPPAGTQLRGFVALRDFINPDHFPALAATLEEVAREAPEHDRSTEFEEGLQLILTGIHATGASAGD